MMNKLVIANTRTANDKNWGEDSIIDYLNVLYAERIHQLIEKSIDNKF